MNILNIFVISTLFWCPFVTNAEPASVSLGIFPYASTSKLISHHKNVKKHINKTTRLNVSLVTAKNLSAYMNNIANNKYDLIYSAPHAARYAEKKYGYQRVAMTSHHIRGVILVKKDSAIKSLSDLENKKLAIAPAKTILHQVALNHLQENNIIPGSNIHLKTVNTHNTAIYEVIKGDSDAAVTGIKLWKKLNPNHKKSLRKLTNTKATTGFIILAKPQLKKSLIKKLQNSFLSFNNTLAGKTYIFRGFKKISDLEMKSLDFHSRVFE